MNDIKFFFFLFFKQYFKNYFRAVNVSVTDEWAD